MAMPPQDLQNPPRPMTQLCALGTHVIQQLPSGRYVCVYDCGLSFTEYHELVLHAGAGAGPQVGADGAR